VDDGLRAPEQRGEHEGAQIAGRARQKDMLRVAAQIGEARRRPRLRVRRL
jgi:hypothetical protein